MSYGRWDSGPRKSLATASEKGWKRKALARWDEHWQRLSVAARSVYLDQVKARQKSSYYTPVSDPGTPVTKFDPAVLKELTEAGLVRVEPAKGKAKPERVVAADEAADFRARIKAIHRIHALTPQPANVVLEKFLNVAWSKSDFVPFVAEVLKKAGLETQLTEPAAFAYVTSSRWPGLAAETTDDPTLAARVLDLFRASPDPVPLAAIARRLKEGDPVKIRAVVDALVSRVALFEDTDASTFEIVVGLLAEVRRRIEAAAARGGRPPLVGCPPPRDLGPDTGPWVDDLRAFLLEVASEPPRLRQDGDVFSKESDRFLQALNPLPDWIVRITGVKAEDRFDGAYDLADGLNLVKEQREGKEARLVLTPAGRKWLAAEVKDQYVAVFETFRALPKKAPSYLDDDLDDDLYPFASSFVSYYGYGVLNDEQFLGSTVAVARPGGGKAKGKAAGRTLTPKVDDLKALREAIGQAFMALPEGVFHRLDHLVDHLVYRDQNVLLTGQPLEKVRVFEGGRPVPALEEVIEDVGRRALVMLITGRLIPLGCVRIAADEGNAPYLARTGRLAAYFGLGPMPDEPVGTAEGSKVVVQPDFSVVVIGLSTAALAELAPFCERTGRGKGPGAEVLKITRESVTRAVGQGLKVSQILDRLRARASHEPPANVLREIRDWGDWVKSVTTQRRVLLRCPDREAADRVVGLLKRQVERLNDTVLALTAEKLTPADRKKLRDHGVLLGTSGLDDSGPTKTKASRRRSY